MGVKLEKNTLPSNHAPSDFECSGPIATKDGDFDAAKLADLGCFKQEEVDSNKFYHASVCKSKVTGEQYVYFEWGRTGRTNNTFQFVKCNDAGDAQTEFRKQLMDKNVKRGEWIDIGGIKTLRGKPGKDCYLVRPLTTRSVGLPDARTIQINDGAKQTPAADTKTAGKAKKTARKTDNETLKLMRDLNVATVAYTRGEMSSDTLPTQAAIEEGRIFLTEAQKRVKVVGNSVKDQIADNELKQLSYALYGRIPKKKPIGAAAETWILSADNIFGWQQDLDAFESALYANKIVETKEEDPFGDLKIDMEWVNPTSETGKFLHDWWPTATGNRHGGMGNMKIRNLWKFERHDDRSKIERVQDAIIKEKLDIRERVPYQPKKGRLDLDDATANKYEKTNTALLFHGTRSVNVSGILRKALMLPKQLVGVVITGAMFGPGLYFADDWKKSAGYTSLRNSYWSNGGGSVAGRKAFMFAADVVLGNPYVAPSSGGYTSPPAGHHCVYGKAGKSGVVNNEWIIYTPMQNKLRYLAEFEC